MANAKLFKLEVTLNGNTYIDIIDTYKNVSRRKTTLTKSYRGAKVTYKIISNYSNDSNDSNNNDNSNNVKFRKKPLYGGWRGGDRQTPRID